MVEGRPDGQLDIAPINRLVVRYSLSLWTGNEAKRLAPKNEANPLQRKLQRSEGLLKPD